MTLVISKKEKKFDFIDPEEESEYHISHLCKEALEKQYSFNFIKKEENEGLEKYTKRNYQKELQYLKEKFNFEFETNIEDNKESNGLKDPIMKQIYLDELNKKPSTNLMKVYTQCSDYKKRHTIRKELQRYKQLIPKKSVWNTSCYNYTDWVEFHSQTIEDIYENTYSYISFLNNNGYDIRLNEIDLIDKLTQHLYLTSQNVQKNYIFLK